MTIHAVHWHEGMFLWPQQLQHNERFLTQTLDRQKRLHSPYHWGLRAIELDEKALGNFHFSLSRIQARFQDGTTVCIPEDGSLSPLDLKPGFEQDNPITIYLAIPQWHAGKPNAQPRRSAKDAKDEKQDNTETRFWLDSFDLEDENTGSDSHPIQVRRLNVKLLMSTQDLSGYEILPIARVEKPAGSDAPPQLDKLYIPPLLACDAWTPLQAGLLQSTYDRFGRHIKLVGDQVVSRAVSFDSRNPGDGLLISQLHAVNQAYTVLGVVAFAAGMHPFHAYAELCRIAGRLSIFGETRKPPDLPGYDHDDLGNCFFKLRLFLETIPIQEPNYEERPFIGKQSRIQVGLEPKWLEVNWAMYVGVMSSLPPEETVRMLTRQGPLDMKIGSSDRVDEIYERGSVGLEFTANPRPPRALPNTPGLVYFQVNRASKQEEWQNVQKSLALAIRLNQSRVLGNIEGQRTITIRAGASSATMQFTLFLVPKDSL